MNYFIPIIMYYSIQKFFLNLPVSYVVTHEIIPNKLRNLLTLP